VRNPFEQLAKQALGPCGLTIADDEIAPDDADLLHEPDPIRTAERERLGLLGRLASVPCLIEAYRHAPDAEEFRACLAKHIAFWQQRTRKTRRAKKKGEEAGPLVEPFLWILAAGSPTAILRGLALTPGSGWPSGVYLGSEILRFGIVVASELPRDRSTILVRLMAGGPQLRHAIEDLGALPEDAHERAVALQILLSLQHALGKKSARTPEEQEFIVTVQQNIVEKLRNEGVLLRARATLRRMLAHRSLSLSSQDEARIEACADVAVLDQWIDQAMEAQSVADALREGSADAPHRAPPGRRRSRRSP
jgi:hypothetical protein